MGTPKSDILQGTLDLMVLQTLAVMGPMHGYGLALRIEQISEEALRVNQGTIYLCFVRLVQRGWIRAEWGQSENNRRAKFYAITPRADDSCGVKPRTGSGFRRVSAALLLSER